MVFGNFRFVCYSDRYDESIEFYKTVMGLERVGGWDDSPEDRGTLFNANNAVIEVIQARPDRPSVRPTGFELRYRVDDVDARYTEVLPRSVPVEYGPKSQPWGERDLAITDPNGIRIILFAEVAQ